MFKVRLFISIQIIWLIIFQANAQNYSFSHYSNRDGLSQSVVYTIYQDSRGFMWFGTQDGLNRFDGRTFVKFLHNPADTNSISDNWIYSITEDFAGNLWIGTRRGLNRYSYRNNTFTQIMHETTNEAPDYKDNIYGCVSASKGIVYTNTPPYINAYDSNSKKTTHFLNNTGNTNLVEEQSLPIIIDLSGMVWAASNTGLVQFNPKTKEFKNFTHDPFSENSLLSNTVLTIHEDRKGNIWVGTNLGVSVFNKSDQLYINYPMSFAGLPLGVQSITSDSNGQIWLGTQQNGIYKAFFTDGVIQTVAIASAGQVINSTSLSHSIVNSLWVDRTDNLWIGTLNGIDKTDLKPPKFLLYKKSDELNSVDMLDNLIASVYKQSDTALWIGNWGKGLNILNRKTNQVKHYSTSLQGKYHIENDYVHVIFQYKTGEIWIGTRDGIFVQKNEAFIPLSQYYKSDKIPDFRGNRIFSIIKDAAGNVWIATQGGLFFINMRTQSTTGYTTDDHNISDNLVYTLLFDADSNLWVATKGGLDKIENRTHKITHFLRNPDQNGTLIDNYCVSLCYTKDQNLWVGTKSGICILRKDSSAFEYITDRDGLPANLVYEIIEDENGDMWLGTGNGLSQWRKKDGKIITFSEADGLQGPEFNLRASHRSADGEIFFGGINGLNSFYPSNMQVNRHVPMIVFTSFQKQNKQGIFRQEITNNAYLELQYGDYAFSIEFAALEYTSPVQNEFEYRIGKKNEDWIPLGNRNFQSFSNMAPGEYRIWVRGCNNDGFWNEKGSFITVKILPPWWRSNWAYATYIFMLLLVIFLFIKMREKALQEQKRMLELKVAERTLEVEKQKNEIVEKNNVLENQNQEILAQRDVLSAQNEKILYQNKQIKDSILYAKRIQTAILPSTDVLQGLKWEHFLIYWPKDIVSGDFYWMRVINNHLVLAVADCTGHGVPGAFMSMLGNAFLNEIVAHEEITEPASVLEKMRKLVIESLRQSGDGMTTRDGMDMAFCDINLETRELRYAGAHNPIFIIRNNDLIELKADRFPVGHHFTDLQPFSCTNMTLKSGDKVYMFTDGIIDQFGGTKGRKLMIQNLRDQILKICKLPFDDQKMEMENFISLWMGKDYEQIDDITLLALKIN